MRIIGYIAHPQYKITVFKMEHRFTVKLEEGLLEQSYKFPEGPGLEGLTQLETLVDSSFLESVSQTFSSMRHAIHASMERHLKPKTVEEEQEEII